MKILGIIPARYGSTRLPGKALIMVQGKTIIQRVYERVKMSKLLDELVVATDDVRIQNHVRKIGGKAVLTRAQHDSGTSRCVEVLDQLPGFDLIVNIQGDEPLINPAQVDQICELMIHSPETAIGTLIKKISDPADLSDPAEAKVVLGANGKVIYFSRNALPYVRDFPISEWLDHGTFYKHIGMYGYTAKALRRIGQLPPSQLEDVEKLEQLNWLYHGIPISAIETEFESIAVDTAEDLELLEKILTLPA